MVLSEIWKYPVFSIVVLFVVLNLFLPLAILIWCSFMKFAGIFIPNMYTLHHYTNAFSGSELLRSIWNTILMAAASATIGMILCSFIGYVVVKTRREVSLILSHGFHGRCRGLLWLWASSGPIYFCRSPLVSPCMVRLG